MKTAVFPPVWQEAAVFFFSAMPAGSCCFFLFRQSGRKLLSFHSGQSGWSCCFYSGVPAAETSDALV